MKPLHIRLLAALPVVTLSVAGLPPFVRWWSATTADLIAMGAWIALLAGIAVTAPFNRWMLDSERDYETKFNRAAEFSLGIVVLVDLTLIVGTMLVSKAMGLGGVAFAAVSLPLSTVIAVGSVFSMNRLFSWTRWRIDEAHDAADRLKRA
ncbi:hypothetical protein [Burkholderia gladioli]|uniref:hypothetical protein n=1 Tax=Burkholderia gladioli TaxID=28095 RepID=UPI00164151F1|nr:hypothetical protein [Burkholderia gladioli]